jgi:Ser/Thr protein kinase RdoA (MazF antagonist)
MLIKKLSKFISLHQLNLAGSMFEEILSHYNISLQAAIESFGTGLINHTWLVKDGAEDYIFQKINQNVFKEPENIAHNIELVDNYLKKNHPQYFFVAPLKTKNGKISVRDSANDYYRLFPFVKGSKTYDVVQTQEQAFEAATQFGLFTRTLSKLSPEKLKLTLPEFHNLKHRYKQFEIACQNGNVSRIKESKNEIEFLRRNEEIVKLFEKLKSSKSFKERITHHDTKISNVLFDKNDQGICVIDLDTVMPGYFISDVGDMMRTYLSPVSEEEKDFSKIEVRGEYFKAILDGYLSHMGDELNREERSHFVYAGKFMVYMQAIRFLTDYLTNDCYYGAAYEQHNYVRAKNQVALLKRLNEKEKVLNELVLNT